MNLPTIIVSIIITAIFVLIVIKGIINRKKGKSSCSCGCGGCAMSEICHGKSEK